MRREPILAAGGIVVRGKREPLIAVVKLRKRKAWVLPKGKLKPSENALAAARREAVEETGHDVSVHEFLGAMSYEVRGKPKVVQFWRMRAVGGPTREPMRDVKAVQWLPLDQAVEKLTHSHEQVFLASVGPIAVAAERSARRSKTAARTARRDLVEAADAEQRTEVGEPAVPQVADRVEFAEPTEHNGIVAADEPATVDDAVEPAEHAMRTGVTESSETLGSGTLIQSLWLWMQRKAASGRTRAD
jgi:8-oxo-dGTP diphosphatase